MWQIPIIHGPNLNLVGEREPSIYGTKSFEDFLDELKTEFPQVRIPYHQSNHEGYLIDWIQDYRNKANAILLNPGAYTHTSIAIRDAISAIKIPVVEIHISDISSRESFRKHSYIKPVAFFEISGHGLDGYRIALQRLLEVLPTISE
ncbi:MAG: 3-dehydroquinate dehydratase [Saprospiraceae bacterium]|nr:3-dehydroquinate dehydratase [Saprospiraceae bacterium]MBK9720598.1 3-dehydroquinate dehydratase [Saprospiraceae bacterium]MBK9727587.1 3-dehydroquinate dehydratase [Saprospiraceae bacterium]